MEKSNTTKKKPTVGELEKRMRNAIVFVPKDKDTQTIYFDDKGLRLTVTMDNAVVETLAHKHVFSAFTPSGASRPYIYIKRLIDIADTHNCIVKDEKGNFTRSYTKLFEVLKEEEDKTDYNLAWYIDLWLFNIFSPLYEIDTTEISSFLVYERYMHNIAANHVLLSEHKEDVTTKEYVNSVLDIEKSFLENMEEKVLLHAKTDEEIVKEEAEEMQKMMEEQVNGQ